jgi:hypothetical protein
LVQLRGTLYFKSEEGCQSGIGCGVKWWRKEITATWGRWQKMKHVNVKDYNYISDALKKAHWEADNLSVRHEIPRLLRDAKDRNTLLCLMLREMQTLSRWETFRLSSDAEIGGSYLVGCWRLFGCLFLSLFNKRCPVSHSVE